MMRVGGQIACQSLTAQGAMDSQRLTSNYKVQLMTH